MEPIAKINLSNILYNLNTIKEKLGQPYKICAVVKADAYGHGLTQTAEYIDKFVDMFAVARAGEAFLLADSKISKPILLLGKAEKDCLNKLSAKNIRISVNDIDDVKAIECLESDLKVYVHLKINSGMNRYGLDSREKLNYCLERLSNKGNIIIEGIYSHYATADGDVNYFDSQTRFFESIIKDINVKYKHISATDAVLLKNAGAGNMVRIGLGLYGYASNNKMLKPAMRLECGLGGVYSYKKGSYIGYGNAWRLEKDSTVAVACIGYGDGLPRLVNTGKLKINDRLCNILGRVCMDSCLVDVTGVDVSLNDKVIIFDGNYGADILAVAANTITYDILTAVTKRVKREYFI